MLCPQAVYSDPFRIFAEWNYVNEPSTACLEKIGFTFSPEHRFAATFELFDQTPAATYAEPDSQAWYDELVDGWFGLGTPPSNSSVGDFDIIILDNEPAPTGADEDNWKIDINVIADSGARSTNRSRWDTMLSRIQSSLSDAGESAALAGFYNISALPDGGQAELKASVLTGANLTEYQENNDDLNSSPQFLIDDQEVGFPAIYRASTDTTQQWNNMVDNKLPEFRRLYGADTPLYAFMWPAYSNANSTEIDGTTWRAMLDKVYTHYQAGNVDGIVIWNGQASQNGLHWSFGKDWYRQTSDFIADNGIGAGGTCWAPHGYTLKPKKRRN